MRRTGSRSVVALIMLALVLAVPATVANTDVNPHGRNGAAVRRAHLACQAGFVITKGTTTIGWSRLSNAASRVTADSDVTPLVFPDGEHDLSAGSGEQARRGESLVTLLHLSRARPCNCSVGVTSCS